MNVHDTLTWLPHRFRQFQRELADYEVAGDGAFSRVYLLNDYLALKLTCCEATRTLFGHLQREPVFGLPKVHKALGKVATDADGITFHGYLLERLFRQGEDNAQRNARLAGRTAGYVPVISPPSQSGEEKAKLVSLFEREHARMWDGPRSPGTSDDLAQADLFLRLAHFGPADYRAAFCLLAGLAREHGFMADLSRENVMEDCFGRLVLADPIANRWSTEDETAHLPHGHLEREASASRSSSEVYLSLRILRQRGETVFLRWDSFETEPQEHSDPSLLEVRRVRFMDEEHRALAGCEIQMPYWQLSSAALAKLQAFRQAR